MSVIKTGIAAGLLTMSLAACGGGNASPGGSPSDEVTTSPAPPAAQLGSEVTLGAGDAIGISGQNLTVKFDKIAQDSRCKPGQTCVWEGDATVAVTADHAGKQTALRLHSNPKFATSASVDGYTVKLVKLSSDGKGVFTVTKG